MAETILDLRGLKCPLPTLRARRALARAARGDVVVVLCTDPLAAIDIPHMARETGNTLEDQARAGEELTFRLRKDAGPGR